VKFPHIANPIRGFAVLCVAVISAYVMVMGYRINEVLAGPTWCARAIGADKVDANSKVDAAVSCVGLLTVQLKSLATNSHILFGVVAMCLLTLIVIVIAGARAAGGVSKTGVTFDISRDDPGDAMPVKVVNPPSAPVPTAEAPKAAEPSPKPV
jgi:hypothetical protein